MIGERSGRSLAAALGASGPTMRPSAQHVAAMRTAERLGALYTLGVGESVMGRSCARRRRSTSPVRGTRTMREPSVGLGKVPMDLTMRTRRGSLPQSGEVAGSGEGALLSSCRYVSARRLWVGVIRR